MNHPKIKVLLADQQPLFAEKMASLLLREADMEVVGIASNTMDCFRKIETAPSAVVLLDSDLTSLYSVEIMGEIDQEYPDTKFILLIGKNPERYIEKSIIKNVAGFLSRDCSIEEVIKAIRCVARGRVYFSPMLSEYFKALIVNLNRNNSNIVHFSPSQGYIRKNLPQKLTKREFEIMELLEKGMKNKEIALALNISVYTVGNHISKILNKFDAKSRLEAIANYRQIKCQLASQEEKGCDRVKLKGE